jgi:hypothetical protein
MPEAGPMRARTLAAMLACGLGCGGEAGPSGGDLLASLVLSDPVPIGGRQVAYLSLPAGSVPQASTATVTNHRTGSTLVLAVQGGGWKAAELEAAGGDSITIRLDLPALVTARAVPEASKPIVVHVEPPRGKRDVPLNARVYIAFSEPVDAATVTPTSIRLIRDGAPVAGRVSVAADGLAATIDPVEDLAPNAEYQVSVSAEVKDLDGDSAVPLTSGFATGATTAAEALDLQLDPSAADFGLAWVGGQGNTRFFRVWNVGLGSGSVIPAIAGAHAADFRIAFDGCGSLVLAPYDECTVQITFAPSGPGARTAVLLVGDASAVLSGTADSDRLHIFPAELDFGPVMAGRATEPTTFVVTNIGTEPSMPLTVVMLYDCTPTNSEIDLCALPFRKLNDGCGGRSLVPGAFCTVSLEFRPGRAGVFAARLAFTSRTTGTARLDGEGLGLSAGIGTEPHQPLVIAWGSTGSLSFSNTGPEPTGPIADPEVSSGFSILSNGCTGILASGSSCSISLRFTSSNGQPGGGVLRLAANPGGTVAAYLNGLTR